MQRIVDTWLFDLDPDPSITAFCCAVLGRDERQRLSQIRRPCDQRRFLARRGFMRMLLGRYLDVDPRELSFAVNRYGKPRLAGEVGLSFNASSSRDIGLCVVSRDAELGCDIEHRDPRLASVAIAERFFTAEERHALQALPSSRWLEGFFDCWTRKEAVVKALGLGFSLPFDSFDMPLDPGEATVMLQPGCAFRIAAFEPSPDLHAAVAIEGDQPTTFVSPRLFGGAR